MPLPFTNVWDQSFPPDTALVSAGAANLRQLRVDVQQRMAAISGTDAAKPNFSADAQAAQWLGILYFALDTARIYQWSGSAWIDVTANIGGGGGGGAGSSGVLGKVTIPVTISGALSVTQMFKIDINPLQNNSVLRITTVVHITGTQQTVYRWHLGPTANPNTQQQVGEAEFNPTTIGSVSTTDWASQLYIANQGMTSEQITTGFGVSAPAGYGLESATSPTTTTVDTTQPLFVEFDVNDLGAGNTTTGYLFIVELL